MDPRLIDYYIIDYYIINSAIPSKIGIEDRYQLHFGNPSYVVILMELSYSD